MPNLGFVNAELIVQEGGLAPLVELLSSSNEVRGPAQASEGRGKEAGEEARNVVGTCICRRWISACSSLHMEMQRCGCPSANLGGGFTFKSVQVFWLAKR